MLKIEIPYALRGWGGSREGFLICAKCAGHVWIGWRLYRPTAVRNILVFIVVLWDGRIEFVGKDLYQMLLP